MLDYMSKISTIVSQFSNENFIMLETVLEF